MSDLVGWIMGVVAAIVPGFADVGTAQYSGYIEADYIYVSSVTPGVLQTVDVSEGAWVTDGDILFSQTSEQYFAWVKAAEAQLAAARANYANLSTGSRPEELAVVEANLEQAEVSLDLANTSFARVENLWNTGLVPESQLDQARSTKAGAAAFVAQLKAQLASARLPARPEALVAARANVEAAAANMESAQVALAERVVHSPVDGRVSRVFFKVGETAATGSPIVALLRPSEILARFFVPQSARANFPLGQRLNVTCDGCEGPLFAKVSFMAVEPQHTPPIIYSRDERSRLVFMAEAQLEGEVDLFPGQPVSLEIVE